MRGAAEHLQRQRRVHAACSFLQKPNVLIFRLTNAAERGPETDAERSCGFSREYSMPASSSAIFADATENCA